jgi:hypothetical protein
VRGSALAEVCEETTLSDPLSFSANVTTETPVAEAVIGMKSPSKENSPIRATERRVLVFNQIRIMILRLEECAPGLTAHLQHHQIPIYVFVPPGSNDSTSN